MDEHGRPVGQLGGEFGYKVPEGDQILGGRYPEVCDRKLSALAWKDPRESSLSVQRQLGLNLGRRRKADDEIESRPLRLRDERRSLRIDPACCEDTVFPGRYPANAPGGTSISSWGSVRVQR